MFSIDDASLQEYSKQLSNYIVANLSGKLFSKLPPEKNYPTVAISLVKGLATNEEEPDSLKIVININEKKPLEVYLCSVDVGKVFLTEYDCGTSQNEESSKFYNLPLLLYSGPKTVFTCFASWLQMNFICYVQPMLFNPIDLSWMLSMWTNMEYIKDAKTNPYVIELVWKLPVEDPDLKTFKYQIAPTTVAEIWDCSKPTEKNEMTVEDVERFMGTITAHLKQLTKIRFDALKLFKISTQFAKIGADGGIKIGAQARVHTVLAHLCCLALERVFPFASRPD